MWKDLDFIKLWDAMLLDKKSRDGKVNFLLPTRLGHIEKVEGVSPSAVQSALEAMRLEAGSIRSVRKSSRRRARFCISFACVSGRRTFCCLPVSFSLAACAKLGRIPTAEALRVLLAFICFCSLSSVGYVINDWTDIARDKLHPVKKTARSHQEYPRPQPRLA